MTTRLPDWSTLVCSIGADGDVLWNTNATAVIDLRDGDLAVVITHPDTGAQLVIGRTGHAFNHNVVVELFTSALVAYDLLDIARPYLKATR